MSQNFFVLVHLRELIGPEYTFMAEPSHSQFSFYCCVQMVFDLNSTVETGYIAARYIAESDIKRALSCLPNIS
jgi:hypothetical protein